MVKPYEPPGLGKPSRVTPVGLDEDPDALSQDSNLLESDSVEVLSVIRFNKSKLGTSSTGTSDKRSSSSDTNSLFNNTNLPCPACDAQATAANAQAAHAAQAAAASRDRRVRSRSAGRSAETGSAHSGQTCASQDMFDLTSLASESMTVATSATSTTTGSLPSIIRRSSAPEIDEALNPDALSRISEVTTSAAPETSTITSSSYRSRYVNLCILLAYFALWDFFREGDFRGSVNTVEPPEIDEALNPDALSRISEVTTSAAPETSTITSSSYRSRYVNACIL